MSSAAPATVTLKIPAINTGAEQIESSAGRIAIPGTVLPAKQIEIDPLLIQTLLQSAREAASTAYVSYSNFRVGAAVVMADDPDHRIYCGANVENSSYGATNCAERTALFHCAARGFRRLEILAVSTLDALSPDTPLAQRSPCGICRQVIREFADDASLIVIDSGDPEILCDVFDAERLLPFGFHLNP